MQSGVVYTFSMEESSLASDRSLMCEQRENLRVYCAFSALCVAQLTYIYAQVVVYNCNE